MVNGQSKKYDNNDLDVGVTNIGTTFIVDVPADTSTITFQVSGIEHDPFFDDTIAGFTQVWGQAQNWGVGAQQGSASDFNITYVLNYQITCAQNTSVVVSREALLRYGQEKARIKRGTDPAQHTPDVLVNWAIDRIRREDWHLTSVAGEQFVFNGYGNFLPLLLKRLQRPAGETATPRQ